MFYLNSDFDKVKAARLLCKYKFINKAGNASPKLKEFYDEEDPKEKIVKFKKITDDECLEWADMEVAEISKDEGV